MNSILPSGLAPIALPHFDVAISPPDIEPWIAGNTGVRGFTTRDSGEAGPHLVLVALTHGNELAGAIALDRLRRDGLEPRRGRLTFGFANLAAFARFDRRRSGGLPLRRRRSQSRLGPELARRDAALAGARPGSGDAAADRKRRMSCSTCLRCYGRLTRSSSAARRPRAGNWPRASVLPGWSLPIRGTATAGV